jgi:hypothetical protein
MDMKNRLAPFYFVIVLFLFPYRGNSQEKFDVSVGLAIPEGYNLGVKYNYQTNRSLDFYYGQSIPFERDEKWRTFSINHAFYFGKINSKTNEKLWSVNTGFLYGISNDSDAKIHNGLLNLFFARELVIRPNIYIEPKLGGSYLLFYDVTRGFINGYIIRLIPNFGLSLGFKI